MKYRILLLATFISLISLSSFAQKPATAAEDWSRFQPDNDGFTVETPLQLKSDGNKDAKSSRKYFGSINGTYLYVFSDPVKSPNNFSAVMRFVDLSGRTLEADSDPSKPTRLAFTDSFGFRQDIVMLRTQTRIYIAQAVSKNENDSVAKRFVSTFGIGLNRFIVSEEINTKPTEVPNGKGPLMQPSGTGGGRGDGSRTGNQNGSGFGGMDPGSSPVKPQPGQTTSIRILSKAKPPYTYFARFYEITGTVRIRVTFLASGEIGAVTPITTLPFGLTENAITAAKSIRFEPAYRDGTPINVVKQVEYSFLIY